jgi:hypothetical protein
MPRWLRREFCKKSSPCIWAIKTDGSRTTLPRCASQQSASTAQPAEEQMPRATPNAVHVNSQRQQSNPPKNKCQEQPQTPCQSKVNVNSPTRRSTNTKRPHPRRASQQSTSTASVNPQNLPIACINRSGNSSLQAD